MPAWLIALIVVASLVAYRWWLNFNREAMDRHGPQVLDKTPKVAASYRPPWGQLSPRLPASEVETDANADAAGQGAD
ncbi:hypothetical protein [Krasilnikovia sp. M28-CT-15]|uniref:hypothetical protein n=1 Tax=Krasilnikovia sp. M28-CT-15 TaxID=3373540 RepID=UPI0038774D4E